MYSNGLSQLSDEHTVMNWDVFSHDSHEIFRMAFCGIVDFIRTSLYTGLQLFRSPGERHENRNWLV